ncbi:MULTISPECIES: hypothetical protein [unclassified Emergencia]|uniref:hypothetical protein n=1 Tax=unclassified Emergencia TaxID=2642996 RepID=UPI00137A7F4B|nr:hypothetical protein [Emergencia sp. 1XD21-10]
MAQLLAIFDQWQSFAWEQLSSSNEARSQREYNKFKDDKADVKGNIRKILNLVPESAL